jgi:hypothetical protein
MNQVITSFSPAGAALYYGRRMVGSFARYWPATIPLVVYLDAPLDPPLSVEERWTQDIREWRQCMARWKPYPHLHGISTPEHPLNKPYKYQRDVARFSVKPFVWRDAARRLGEGILTWFDGDTMAVRPVPDSLPAKLLGAADVAYLGRGSMHPENGYVGFRIPEALPLLEWCCEAYTSDRVLDIPHGWTDCHVLRAGLATVPVKARDLTSHLYEGKSQIWPVSPLAKYVTHLKGKAKRKRGAK